MDMAVQQNKKSKSRKNMRRSHYRVDIPTVVICKCGEPALPHAICPSCGNYRGRQLAAPAGAEN